MPTPNPCDTGLVCPKCRQPIAMAGHVGPQGVTLHCPGCGHTWLARDTAQDLMKHRES